MSRGIKEGQTTHGFPLSSRLPFLPPCPHPSYFPSGTCPHSRPPTRKQNPYWLNVNHTRLTLLLYFVLVLVSSCFSSFPSSISPLNGLMSALCPYGIKVSMQEGLGITLINSESLQRTRNITRGATTYYTPPDRLFHIRVVDHWRRLPRGMIGAWWNFLSINKKQTLTKGILF